MRKAKIYLFSIILLFFCVPVFCQEEVSPKENSDSASINESVSENISNIGETISDYAEQINKDLSHSIQFYQAFYVPPTINNEFFGEQLLYTAKWKMLQGTAGIAVTNSRFDVVGKVTIQPDFFEIPFGNKYCFYMNYTQFVHFRTLFDVSSQTDFLSGLKLGITTETGWDINAEVYYLLKLSSVYNLNKLLIDNDLALSLHFNKEFGKSVICYGISSYDYFYYPKFFSPQFHLEYGYRFWENILTTLTLNIRYVDMLTLSSYLEEVEIKLGVGVDL